MLRTLDEKVSPAHAALLVVDVQNDFLDTGGAFAPIGRDVTTLHGMVSRLELLIEQARQAGVLVIFVQYCHNKNTESEVHVEQRMRGRAGMPICQEGTWGADFFKVAPKPDDLIVKKHRYSAFVGTDLDVILRSSGIRSLILTGVATNGCVEATARDGFMNDYYIVFVDDCCACYSAELHAATLTNITDAYGIVVTSDEVGASWRA